MNMRLSLALISLLIFSTPLLATESLSLVYTVTDEENQIVGEAALHLSDTKIANHYKFADINLSQITKASTGTYFVIHASKLIYFRDYAAFSAIREQDLTLMAAQTGSLTKQDIWEMSLDPRTDPSSVVFNSTEAGQFDGIRDDFVVYKVETQGGIQAPVSAAQLVWLKKRLKEQMLLPQSGLGLSDNLDEFLRQFTYFHDAIPQRIEDLDAGFMLTLKELKWDKTQDSQLALPSGYATKDITQATLDIVEYLESLD